MIVPDSSTVVAAAVVVRTSMPCGSRVISGSELRTWRSAARTRSITRFLASFYLDSYKEPLRHSRRPT